MIGSGEERLVGTLALLLAAVVLWRVIHALRTGVVPLYRRRADRSELGPTRFWFAVMVQFGLALLLAVIAADLLPNFNIGPHQSLAATAS